MMTRFNIEKGRIFHYQFLHVGKCGGETIIKSLRDQRLKCTAFHVGTSPQDIREVILRERDRDAYVVPLRDPFRRFVSAFEWDLYSKVLTKPGKRTKNGVWQRIFQMFRTANDVAEALSDSDSVRRETAELAVHSSSLHMQMDLGWYLPPDLAHRLPLDRTIFLRTSYLDGDIPAFLKTLGLTMNGPVPCTKSDYKKFIPRGRLTTSLSALAKDNLYHAKRETFETLDVLRSRFPECQGL